MSEQLSPFDSPKYLEAVEKERVNRDASFMPINERIERFEVRPMSLRHFLILRTIGSPLLGGRIPTHLEVAAFLWVLSPDYSRCPKQRNKFMAKCRKAFVPGRFFKKRKLQTAVSVINAAHKYVDETFADKPASQRGAKIEKEFYSDAAAVCARFAREYGWDDEATLDKPMKRIFQYFKEQEAHRCYKAGTKPVLFNPSEKYLMEGAT